MARRTTISDDTTGGNVFADLGLPRPEQELLKADLTLHIYRNIKARHLTPAEAGKFLGLKQPQASLLVRNRAGNLSVDRLMGCLTALGHDVEILVRRTRTPRRQMSVVVAA